MEEVHDSLVNSIGNYLDNLRYFAKDNPKTSKDIMTLIIALDVYDWAVAMNAEVYEINKIEKLIKSIINNNNELEFPVYSMTKKYRNVNLPGTEMVWKITPDITLSTATYLSIDGVQGNRLVTEANKFIII